MNIIKKELMMHFESHVQHSTTDDDHELDHEAILGSRQTAQEFETLSVDESKRRLRKLVETGIDADHNGYVDHDELQSWVLKSFKNLAIEEGEERLNEEDLNNDQFVTWDEHLKISFDLDDELKLGDEMVNEFLEEDKVLWKAADLNNDNRLDAKEFAAFNNPEEFEHMFKTLIEQMFERRDQNKDGFIDFKEFISDENGNVPDLKSEHYISEKDKFENDYDQNNDGRLDFNECINWIIPNNTEIAMNEALHLISSADTNHDNRLSIDEIIDNHDVFVGSEATDFGQQLHTHVTDEL
ncbi:Calcium ion binding [Dermatophagoides pteronyssinus]|uniref:Calcium ion binding n=1 Tax=Dermatophagoides pteronyssinus TaxID=6956 RepID=A0ABQ8IT47_DERPT|nr:Calcium ion binding [Dermatophagoides pteronyssinus]